MSRNRRTMRKDWYLALPLVLALLTLGAAPTATPLAGTWSGVLNFGGSPLLLVLKIDRGARGYSATASSPYRGGGTIAVDALTRNGDAIAFSIAKLGVSFSGALEAHDITGTFTQRGTSVALELIPDSLGTSDYTGAWLGTLDAAGTKLLIGLRVARAANGSLSAVLDSPDQHGFGIPIAGLQANGHAFAFSIPKLGVTYRGTPADGAIGGTFTQNGVSFPLAFSRPQVTQAVHPAPTPMPTAQPHFTSTTVQFTSNGATLAGTLTVPDGARGMLPAFVFIGGSGPSTRNGGDAENPTFLDLSNALSNAGVIVLRYDKRGIGKSGGTATEDWKPLAADARAAVGFLAQQPHVDPKRIFLLGHSEGGLVAPLAAQNDRAVAGLVLMAPPAVPMSQLIAEQSPRMPPTMHAAIERAFHGYDGIDPAVVIAHVRVPVLVLQGTDDLQVLPSDLHHLSDAARAAQRDVTIKLLRGDDHLFVDVPQGHPPFWEYTVAEPLDPRVPQDILAWLRRVSP